MKQKAGKSREDKHLAQGSFKGHSCPQGCAPRGTPRLDTQNVTGFGACSEPCCHCYGHHSSVQSPPSSNKMKSCTKVLHIPYISSKFPFKQQTADTAASCGVDASSGFHLLLLICSHAGHSTYSVQFNRPVTHTQACLRHYPSDVRSHLQAKAHSYPVLQKRDRGSLGLAEG